MARGGNRGGGRGRGNEDRETQVSKKLSWLLRHGAEKEGLKLGKGGYVNLADVLSNRTLKSLQPQPTLSEIQQIVATNAKQRFSLILASSQPQETSSDSQPTVDPPLDPPPNLEQNPAVSTKASDYLIRANQGHSLALSAADLSELLTPLTLDKPEQLPTTVVHGTRQNLWQTILKSGGLKPMTRTHVHLATGVPAQLRTAFALDLEGAASAEAKTAGMNGEDGTLLAVEGAKEGGVSNSAKADQAEVKSGMRNSSSLLIFVDIRKALSAGVEFFISENGVVLTAGKDGVLGVEFFEKAVQKGGVVLIRDGKVL